ncbi:hypothetical protein TNCV_308591 [Trichonephila clavipes]|nr:hypothetical protein TNCV_308591 [Trichonephila clavipes]
MKLAEFNVELEHHPGAQNVVAYVLSRNLVESIVGENIACAVIRDLAISPREQLISEQRQDPELGHIYRYLENPYDSSVNATVCGNWSLRFLIRRWLVILCEVFNHSWRTESAYFAITAGSSESGERQVEQREKTSVAGNKSGRREQRVKIGAKEPLVRMNLQYGVGSSSIRREYRRRFQPKIQGQVQRKKGRFSQAGSNKKDQVHITSKAETSPGKPVPDIQKDQCKPSREQSDPEENNSVDQAGTTSIIIDSSGNKGARNLLRVKEAEGQQH